MQGLTTNFGCHLLFRCEVDHLIVAFQILVTFKNLIAQHYIIDEGASTMCVISTNV